jgi:hypothetical protein
VSARPPPPPPLRHEQELLSLYLGSGSAGGARHCGAPMLRRYAATSAWLKSMANLSAVSPSLPHQADSERKMVRGGRAEAPVPRSDVSFRLDQKTGNFKVAFDSRPMQWSPSTEGKQTNELAKKEFRFIKNNNKKGGATTLRPSPLHQRYTAAKDGQLQGGHCQQSNAVESIH